MPHTSQESYRDGVHQRWKEVNFRRTVYACVEPPPFQPEFGAVSRRVYSILRKILYIIGKM
jgi:hypothetical protein